MSIIKSKYLTKEDFIEIYKNNGNAIADENSKKSASDFIEKNDIPSTKNEKWRKTDLTSLLNHRFEYGENTQIDELVLTIFNLTGKEVNILVFVNGFFQEKFSRFKDNKENFVLTNLKNSKNENKIYFERFFNKTEPEKNNLFSALNTLYASDGAFVLLKKNSKIENPIHIYHFVDGNNKKISTLMRNLIIAEENSKAHILFSFHPLSRDYMFTNVVNEIFCHSDSYVDFNIFQGEGDDTYQLNLTKVKQEKNSSFYCNTFTLCGQIVRNDLNIDIEGENCFTELNGLYMPDREQHFDNTIFVNHKTGHSSSRQFYRGILDNNATAVFFGQSKINKDAVKTDVQQKNNNILLSHHSKVHSKPQLIIHNDDVKASHGSTVGQLDQEAMYYMRTRGIGEKQAKILMISAFAEEIIDKVQIEKLKYYYKFLVEKRLLGDKVSMQCTKLGECRNC